MIKIALGVSEFALPAPRRGSIDSQSGLGRGPEVGIEIHQEIQAARAKEFSSYQAEVFVTHTLPIRDYELELRGRMDGVFTGPEPKIEEIKSTFNIYDLQRKLRESRDEHPYCLQLKTYGYLYWLQNGVVPKLILQLVSSRNKESLDYELKLDLKKFESYFQLRLEEVAKDADLELKRMARRKKAVAKLPFPFAKPRNGQLELIETIQQGMQDEKHMLLQAPTGLGKTVGVLYPALKEALARGQRVIYATPKNSQHAVAEEAIEKLQAAGGKLKSLTITAKSKMCFKNEAICNPDYCEFAKDHYTKVAENKVAEQLQSKRKLTARTFKKIAKEFEVCPFEIQLDAAVDADTIICDYNYVFASNTAFGSLAKEGLVENGRPNLVIDEAHNLPSRAQDYYSSSLSKLVLEKMRDDVNSIPRKFRSDMQKLITDCIAVIERCGRADLSKAHLISPPFEQFAKQDAELKSFLSSYLSSDVDIQPKDVVMRLSFYWSEFTNALEFAKAQSEAHKNRFFTSFAPHPATVKITCCGASEMLKGSYGQYAQVIAFSATLKPFNFYSQLSGLHSKKLMTAEFASPFEKDHRKVLVIPQISTKYSERDRNYPRIAEVITKITQLQRGHYIAFFPSFDFMERVLSQLKVPRDVEILKQEKGMRREEVDAVLERLKETSTAKILFAVQGGVFSEGVDYPGKMVIGVFVIGPPLPNFDLEREKMRAYYEENYAAGFDYAYTYPAMAKAVQAAGRVIRTETDRGVIILMDNRFIQSSYAKSMPQDWYENDSSELVSQSILKDLSDFWTRANSES